MYVTTDNHTVNIFSQAVADLKSICDDTLYPNPHFVLVSSNINALGVSHVRLVDLYPPFH